LTQTAASLNPGAGGTGGGVQLREDQPARPGLPGFSALEALIIELAWAEGGDLDTGEICERVGQHRMAARSTVETAVRALVRKGHLERAGCDGAWRYRAAQTMAAHLGQLIAGLLARSPDQARTLALAGITAPPASRPAHQGVRVAICYDGCWYQHAARYLAHERGGALSVAGLHDAIRWHAAGVFACPVQQVTISQAHYVAGQSLHSSWCDSQMADHGVTYHPVPVTAAKGEVGADVELALTCYQLACETSPDMVVLLAGDGDFAPLAARLAGRGLHVVVPVANFSYPRPGDGATVSIATSAWLTRRATGTPALAALLAAADSQDYPPFLARPFPRVRTPRPARSGSRRGTVTAWPLNSSYGFITDDDGLTWFAPSTHTPGHTRLQPGCRVTFDGNPDPPPGKTCPPAHTIVPLPHAGPATVTTTADHDDLNAGELIPDHDRSLTP
jgi:predicted transcriptional regulator